MKLDATNVCVDLQAQRILEDIEISVKEGEIVGLIGPNGSGKSTFLRAVYRRVKPCAGQISVGEENVWSLTPRQVAKRIAVVQQQPQSEFGFLVREIVNMGRMPHKQMLSFDDIQDDEIVNEALARVKMTAFAERPSSSLSGGERQRVFIARALAQRTELLILDEPTNHLDIQCQIEILELLKTLGITTFLTLHDMNLAAAYCNRLYVISSGHIVAQGTPEEVLTPSLMRNVFGVDAIVGRHPVTGRPHLAFLPISKLS